MPGCLEILLKLLSTVDPKVQESAARTLRSLVVDNEVAKAVAGVPDCLKTVFDLFQKNAASRHESSA